MKIQVPVDGVVTIQLPKDYIGETLLVRLRDDGVELMKALVIKDQSQKPTTSKELK